MNNLRIEFPQVVSIMCTHILPAQRVYDHEHENTKASVVNGILFLFLQLILKYS